jgi:hypothetical protein
MAAPAVLSARPGHRIAASRRWCLPAVLALLVAPLTAPGGTPVGAAADAQADLERYRELTLVLMVAEGAAADWVRALNPEAPATGGDPPATAGLAPPFPVQELQTPLNRIVDQRQAVADAARIFRFALDRQPDIRAELTRIAADYPDRVASLDPARLAEDALIIRTALAGSIEFLARDAYPQWLNGLAGYQQKTIYLRNMMEYWAFDRELVAITDQALLDTGSRMEAYQRLLEVDPRLDAFTQHLRAVEFIYRQKSDKQAKPPDDPSEELIEAASQVD